MPPGYPDYLDLDLEENSLESGEGESDIGELLDELEQGREVEEEILEDLIGDIEEEIDRVSEVYEENVSKLQESIRKQSELLERAKSGAGEDKREVRDRLARLYRELRSERRKELENRLDLKMRKWDLERELEELDAGNLEFDKG